MSDTETRERDREGESSEICRWEWKIICRDAIQASSKDEAPELSRSNRLKKTHEGIKEPDGPS